MELLLKFFSFIFSKQFLAAFFTKEFLALLALLIALRVAKWWATFRKKV